jgi:hypothetical protein
MSDMFDTCMKGIADKLEADTPRAVRAINKAGELPTHIVLKSNLTPQTKVRRTHILLQAYPESAVAIHPPTTLLCDNLPIMTRGGRTSPVKAV